MTTFSFLVVFGRVTKRVQPNGSVCQPELKGMGWVTDFNLSTRSGMFCPVRQVDGPSVLTCWPVLKE